jgi:hypothetical protein
MLHSPSAALPVSFRRVPPAGNMKNCRSVMSHAPAFFRLYGGGDRAVNEYSRRRSKKQGTEEST